MTSMTTRIAQGGRAEALVAVELESVGFTVTNLNALVGNCPFADLLARRSATRLLVQVKSTTTDDGKFGAPAPRARGLHAIGAELDCQTIYAFVHLLAAQPPQIRYATAVDVADLAEADETTYVATNRYHVNMSQLTADVHGIIALL